MEEDKGSKLALLQKVIDEAKHFSDSQEEKNVFSLGGRGHYENPISDLLAFFLNPQEQHKLGDLFIVSLFDCLKPETKAETLSADTKLLNAPVDIKPPSREVYTDKGNRIDLLIESKDEIIVIENKIYHSLVNPLEEYRNYVDSQYTGKTKYLVVLALSTEPPSNFAEKATSPGWRSYYVSYRKYLDALNKNIGTYLMQASNNKWLVIMREFQLNLERMIKMSQPLEQEKVNFVAKNIPGISSIQHLWTDFLGYIEQNIQAKFNGTGQPSITRNTWGNGTALRFYGGAPWTKGANLTVVVLAETGFYRLGIYFPGVQQDEMEKIHKVLNADDKYDEAWESSWRKLWGRSKDDWQELTPMFEETGRIIKLMNDYYKKS